MYTRLLGKVSDNSEMATHCYSSFIRSHSKNLLGTLKLANSLRISNALRDERVINKYLFSRSIGSYGTIFKETFQRPEVFWAAAAESVDWIKKWDQVLDNRNPPFTRW